jgi:glutamyl-tRNA reductase
MSTTTHLSAISFAYPAVPGALRAGIAAALATSPSPPAGTFLLSTCLRVDVVVEGDEERLGGVLGELFATVPEVPGAVVRTGPEAAIHLFRVAAGLESPVRGEIEILTQVRRAVQTAKDHAGTGGQFAKLLEAAVASGRAARELFPVSPHDSLAAVAAQVVGFPDSAAVLGNGAMAGSVVDALLSLPVPPKVTVVARTPGRLNRPGVEEWTFDRADEALARFPAVVSATSAKQRLIPDDQLAAVLAARQTPLTLVDMAMPPDFAPPPSAGLRYVDIDQLATLAGRRPATDDADDIVTKRAEEAYRRFAGHQRVCPVIERLMADADEVVEQTVARFAGRLRDGEDEAVLHQTAHTVARTLLAGPLGYLNRSQTAGDVEVIAEAFGAGDDADG